MEEEEEGTESMQEETFEEEEEIKSEKSKDENNKESRGSKASTAASYIGKQQHLFLVEFLVDTVAIDSCAVDEEILDGQTCITLTFLNFPPMQICEKDFDPNKETHREKVRFNSGKSLMFAFNETQCDHPPPLLVDITVSKKINKGELTCKVDIGTIKICVSDLFKNIVEIAKFKPDRLPASKSIKDCFMLIGPGKRTMGEISVYIRLSCLGQTIVTEFQCGPDLKKNPVLFKSREGKKVYEFLGNNAPVEGVSASPRIKQGCGCVRLEELPSSARGGQGDVEKSKPSAAKNICSKGNRVILDIPNKSKQSQGDCKVEKCDESYKCGNARVMIEPKKAEKMTLSQGNATQDQNCFVLRVGDKGQIPDRGKMILELKTPKQRIPPKILPPYHEDIGVQTEGQKKKKKKGKKKGKKKKSK